MNSRKVFLGHNEMEITIPINYFSAPDNVANFQVLANPLSLYKMRITFTLSVYLKSHL